MAQTFRLIYANIVKRHLRAIEKKHHSLIRKTIENQLLFEPMVETRNRKRLRQPAPFQAVWELRFGPGNRFRVFYEKNRAAREVHILAIGVKRGNRLIVGDEEIML